MLAGAVVLAGAGTARADPLPELGRILAKEGATGPATLRVDESLSRAAGRHAEALLRDPTNASFDALEEALMLEGLADARLLPFAGFGRAEELFKEARLFAQSRAHGRGMTHLGLAARTERGRAVWVVIFSRRLIELAPMPRRLEAPAHRVRGRLAAGARRPSAFVTSPDGAVQALEVKVRDSAVAVDVSFDRGAGAYTVEILAETGLGPEVVALWRFFFKSEPRPIAGALEQAPDTSAGAHRLLARARHDRTVAPLADDPRLARAAEIHAQAVCSALLAAHVLPGGTTPEARARQAGYPGPIAENIAIAASVPRAHRNLLASPSHRRNLLDPLATRVGIGLASAPGGVCVVQLFGYGELEAAPQDR